MTRFPLNAAMTAFSKEKRGLQQELEALRREEHFPFMQSLRRRSDYIVGSVSADTGRHAGPYCGRVLPRGHTCAQ